MDEKVIYVWRDIRVSRFFYFDGMVKSWQETLLNKSQSDFCVTKRKKKQLLVHI